MPRHADVPSRFVDQSTRVRTGHVSVLVVDDVHATRAGLAELLRLRGFDVYEAGNGREALDLLCGHPDICVVVLDLMMPQADGYWFRERQLQDPEVADVPVIVFTGSANPEMLSKLHLSHVLLKPFSVDDLLGAIGRYCDTSSATH
jgi:CheY-like chemotaxis protein